MFRKFRNIRKLPLIMTLLLGFMTFAGQATELRMSADQLNTQISEMTVIDVRPYSDYEKAHLPNALSLPVNKTYLNKATSGTIISPPNMQKWLRELGLTAKSNVVVYDDGALIDAARVFWVLEVYGFKHVKVLNQGYEGWKEQGYPTTHIIPKPNKSHYVVQVNNKRLASTFQTRLATLNPNQIIIDARPNRYYIGEQSTAKRAGHIPSAINIPASHNIETWSNFSNLQTLDELKKIYESIPKNKKIITYCAIGRISATNYLALRELGYDVANYDASWRAWANDFSLPIATGQGTFIDKE